MELTLVHVGWERVRPERVKQAQLDGLSMVTAWLLQSASLRCCLMIIAEQAGYQKGPKAGGGHY